MNIRVKECPFCGGGEFTKGIQFAQGSVMKESAIGDGQRMYHIFCVKCGSVVRSYVEYPKKLDEYR